MHVAALVPVHVVGLVMHDLLGVALLIVHEGSKALHSASLVTAVDPVDFPSVFV